MALGTQAKRLMTWKRKCPKIFPYGYSIGPVLVTLLLLQVPTLAIAFDTLSRSLVTVFLPVFILILNMVTVLVMISLVCIDPGILPQNVNNYEWDETLHQLPGTNHNMISDKNYLNIMPSGLSVSIKYCVECHLYRPLRTIHCRVCNHCVQRYDHHCPWIGMCVGKHNYNYFFAFLVLINIVIILVITTALIVIVEKVNKGVQIKEYILQIIVGLFALGFGVGLIKLLVYHLELLWSGLTTNQDLKDTYGVVKGKVPFSRCESSNQSFFGLQMKMMRSNEVQMEYDNRNSLQQGLHKGKRYSTLVSGRQSVLNSLVQSPL